MWIGTSLIQGLMDHNIGNQFAYRNLRETVFFPPDRSVENL